MAVSLPTGHLFCIANHSAISERAAQGNFNQFNSLGFLLPFDALHCNCDFNCCFVSRYFKYIRYNVGVFHRKCKSQTY
jgi:hypothetical protein